MIGAFAVKLFPVPRVGSACHSLIFAVDAGRLNGRTPNVTDTIHRGTVTNEKRTGPPGPVHCFPSAALVRCLFRGLDCLGRAGAGENTKAGPISRGGAMAWGGTLSPS
jgi:hypothetical protein